MAPFVSCLFRYFFGGYSFATLCIDIKTCFYLKQKKEKLYYKVNKEVIIKNDIVFTNVSAEVLHHAGASFLVHKMAVQAEFDFLLCLPLCAGVLFVLASSPHLNPRPKKESRMGFITFFLKFLLPFIYL